MWKQQKVSKRESEIKRSGSSNGNIQNHTQNFERSWEMADRKMTYIYTHTNNRKNGRRQQKNTHQCYILWNWNAGAHIHKGEMWYILLNPRKIPVYWEHCVRCCIIQLVCVKYVQPNVIVHNFHYFSHLFVVILNVFLGCIAASSDWCARIRICIFYP